MKYNHIRKWSVAALVAGLAFSITDGALAQNENASPTAHENANENAEGAGAQAAGADDLGGPDGHSCGGLGHVISQGEGHEDDECGDIVGTQAGMSGSQSNGSQSGNPICTTAGLKPLLELFDEEQAEVIEQTDEAAIAELESCLDVAGDPEVQSAVAANPALKAALDARGYSVDQVVAADARAEVPTLYVAVPD